MRNIGTFQFLVFIFAAAQCFCVYAGETMDAIYLPVGTLTVSAPRGVIPQRAPVTFPHSQHFDYTCKDCHHTWNGKEPVKGCAASGCHDQLSSKTPGGEKLYFKTAYHRSCLGCHTARKQKRVEMEQRSLILSSPLPKTGPTGCNACHPR